uniref:Uncharacterized protein n=1 Tax=Arundo donax TaxID=35708 RepID=A0A0A9E2N9_ARUDO
MPRVLWLIVLGICIRCFVCSPHGRCIMHVTFQISVIFELLIEFSFQYLYVA